MTLTPKINIWTEALLAFSVACLVLILPSIVADDLMNGTQSGKFFFFTYSLLSILIHYINRFYDPCTGAELYSVYVRECRVVHEQMNGPCPYCECD